MRRIRVLMIALVMAATAVFVGAASPAVAGPCEPGVHCTIWQSPICREEVPKVIRVAAGCFNIQP